MRSTRTNISGLAPTRYSVAPRLRRKPYGDGLVERSRRYTALGFAGHGSKKVCESTHSKRLPTLNSSLALTTFAEKSPAA